MTSADAWYPVSDLPSGRVVVRVIWHGATFLAMRLPKPRGKAWGWATVKGGDLQWLPLACPANTWTAQPDVWQPQNSETWVWPTGLAPEALPADVVLAALASREVVPAVSEAVEPDERLWWHNPALIAYEPAGECTERGVEGRLCRALVWCGVGQGIRLRAITPSTIIARLAERAAAIQAGDYYDDPRFRPLPKDVGDFDVAMGWFVRLAEQTEVVGLNRRPMRKRRASIAQRGWPLTDLQECLFLRAYDPNLTWETIGSEMRVSYQRAQQLYAQGLHACWRVANGKVPFVGRPSVDQIAALQLRNRQHKLAETLA